jgi:type IV secretory pathway VirB3-like protein
MGTFVCALVPFASFPILMFHDFVFVHLRLILTNKICQTNFQLIWGSYSFQPSANTTRKHDPTVTAVA